MTISDKFTNLDEDKKRRILNAALKEFADYGYDKASTNRIVEEAGIGKGMLFYYFKSKEDLFYYLVEYALDRVTREYVNIDVTEPDLIERYKKTIPLKMRTYAENPHLFNFFGTIYINKDIELPKDLEKRLEEVRELGYSKIFENIDTSLFREDIEAEKVLKLIQWTISGYEGEVIGSLRGQRLSSVDFNAYWDELVDYLNILKKVYYRQEAKE